MKAGTTDTTTPTIRCAGDNLATLINVKKRHTYGVFRGDSGNHRNKFHQHWCKVWIHPKSYVKE